MRLNPPSIFVFLISVLLAALALISKFGAIGVNVPATCRTRNTGWPWWLTWC